MRRHTRAARTGETTAMRAFPLAFLCLGLGLGLGLVAASETATAPSSFTCVSANRGGTCFVASCAQLHAAVDAGVAHITLYRNLTKCSFPLRVSRPLTVRGACGDGTSKCSVSGGGVLVRQDRSACRQRCTRCENGQGPLFDVREGGRLTLANLELRGACNARDGAGGAVVVRGSTSNGRDDDAEKLCSGAVARPPNAWADADEATRVVRDLEDERTSSLESKTTEVTASLVAVGVAFVENLVVGGGGSPASSSSSSTPSKSSSILPSAPWNGRGGAVALFGRGASATFVECAFQANEAWGSASASLDAYAADVGEGGAVFARRGVVRFHGSVFQNNVAEKEGGALYADKGARVEIKTSTFRDNVVADDYWDGGGAVFLGDAATFASVDVARFVGNEVAVYPDARRKALTCGGGAVSVVRGAVVSFQYALFEKNRAGRGGAVCAHDGEVRFSVSGPETDEDQGAASAVFRENQSAHDWFGKPGGKDVECVQCFFGDDEDEDDGNTKDAGSGDSAGARSVSVSPAVSLSKCAFVVDDDAKKKNACAPPRSAFAAFVSDAAFASDAGTDTFESPGTPPSGLESAFAAALLGEPNGLSNDASAFVAAAGSSSAADAVSSARRASPHAPRATAEGSF